MFVLSYKAKTNTTFDRWLFGYHFVSLVTSASRISGRSGIHLLFAALCRLQRLKRKKGDIVSAVLSHWRLTFCRVYSEHYTANNRSTIMHEPGNEKVATARCISMPMTRPMMMAAEPRIKPIRKILVIIIGVCRVNSRQAGTLMPYFEGSDFDSFRPSRCFLRFVLHCTILRAIVLKLK